MVQLLITIPDELAEALRTDPLALAVDDYCRRALEDALGRRAEARAIGSELGAELAQAMLSLPAPPPATDGHPKLHTVAETAELLRVSKDKVNQMVDTGELECLRLGRRKLIPAAAVEELIKTTS